MQSHTSRVDEKGKNNAELREYQDRLVLLPTTEPREGWEPEFRQTRRCGIERLAVRGDERESDD